jgi:hypothetical protein
MKLPKYKQSDLAMNEREELLLMGDAARAEYMRRTHAGINGGHSDSPSYLAEVTRLRRAQGGLCDRLREAAAKVYHQGKPQSEAEYKCFIGRNMHAKGYKYEA